MNDDAPHWSAQPPRSASQATDAIEQGHFVIGMMPSFLCQHDCPHCYLTTAMRRDPARLSPEAIARILGGVRDYYRSRGLGHVTIHVHHYGGEPTTMGVAAMLETLDAVDDALPEREGFIVRHSIQSALTGVDLAPWIPVFRDRCGNYVQTSYDGLMRGRRYDREWRDQVACLREAGIDVSTISTINRRLIEDGPDATLRTLEELDICEAGFLVLLYNAHNEGPAYDRLAPRMQDWSDFMIALTRAWIDRRAAGGRPPELGPVHSILWKGGDLRAAHPNPMNLPSALFLLPNGDWALSDYRSDGREYLRPFANGLTTTFHDMLQSPARRAFLRKQVLRNGNPECQACDLADTCMMEIWKSNVPGDECFGAKRYVQWVHDNAAAIRAAHGTKRVSRSFF